MFANVMETRLPVEISPQPDNSSCGPTCLHAIYRYYGENIKLDQVIGEVQTLKGGGTLAVILGCHALKRGYNVKSYTYNLQLFDPTWFNPDAPDIRDRLVRQMTIKKDRKLRKATLAYLDYLELGGKILFEDHIMDIVKGYLQKSIPILAGLSATYLYKKAREISPQAKDDDVHGEPVGHFVVLTGYIPKTSKLIVADPYVHKPFFQSNYYKIDIDRVISSIFLGVLTYDSNLLIIEPGKTLEGPIKCKT